MCNGTEYILLQNALMIRPKTGKYMNALPRYLVVKDCDVILVTLKVLIAVLQNVFYLCSISQTPVVIDSSC